MCISYILCQLFVCKWKQLKKVMTVEFVLLCPSPCLCPALETSITYMVATHTSQLLIYQDATLKWASKLEHIPVAIRVGQFQ